MHQNRADMGEVTSVRTIRRLCVAAAVVFGTGAFVLPTGARADLAPSLALGAAPPGTIFAGVGAATSVHEQFDAVGGVAVVVEPEYDNLPDALTIFNGDTQVARASTYYPGAAIATGGPFFCGQVIEPNFGPLASITCNPPPGYPLMAQAPTLQGKPDAATPGTQQVGAGPVNLTAVSATAHADHSYVDAAALDGSFSSAGASQSAAAVLAFRRAVALATSGPAAAAAVTPQASDSSTAAASSASATSHQSWNRLGQLVVTATSTVKGASLLGGAVKISSIVATSTFTTDGGKVKQHSQQVTVSGVTAGGMPATIDQNGITVNGAGTGKAGIDAVNAALQQLLASTSTHIRVLSPTTSSKPGQVPAALDSASFGAACTSGEADGVQLYQQLDASQLPQGQNFFFSVTMGSACSDATVFPAAPTTLLPPITTPTPLGDTGVGGPVGSATAPSQSPGDLSGAPTAPGNVTPSATGPLAASSGGAAARGGGLFRRLEGDLAGHSITSRFSLLYLAFVFAFAALALGILPFLRARLPHTS
jgi:hypothetical protein